MGTRMSDERKELAGMRRLNERERDMARKKERRNKQRAQELLAYKRYGK